jgi:hypothetical protein
MRDVRPHEHKEEEPMLIDPPGVEEIYEHFQECLCIATSNIQHTYMFLPIAGAAMPVYRERVYCYELYHQLRLVWGNYEGYSLGGEVDKTHHPMMVGPDVQNTKPDLLVHGPGDMDGNLIIVEVKPIIAKKPGIRKDLRTLTAFLRHARYHHAIYLIYGSNPQSFHSIVEKANVLREEDVEGRIDLNAIELFWHREPQQAAEQFQWDAA